MVEQERVGLERTVRHDDVLRRDAVLVRDPLAQRHVSHGRAVGRDAGRVGVERARGGGLEAGDVDDVQGRRASGERDQLLGGHATRVRKSPRRVPAARAKCPPFGHAWMRPVLDAPFKARAGRAQGQGNRLSGGNRLGEGDAAGRRRRGRAKAIGRTEAIGWAGICVPGGGDGRAQRQAAGWANAGRAKATAGRACAGRGAGATGGRANAAGKCGPGGRDRPGEGFRRCRSARQARAGWQARAGRAGTKGLRGIVAPRYVRWW